MWPATAEVAFRDERFTNPVNTEVQFHAAVYNAPSSAVVWRVHGLEGGPGRGTVDASGLYVAPLKDSLPYELTEIVSATAVDDPFRVAYASITVIGLGPEPKPAPHIEVYPRTVCLYYAVGNSGNNEHNEYIDISNKMQLFRARVHHAAAPQVEWYQGVNHLASGLEYLYKAPNQGPVEKIEIEARLVAPAAAVAHASVLLLNYFWPATP